MDLSLSDYAKWNLGSQSTNSIPQSRICIKKINWLKSTPRPVKTMVVSRGKSRGTEV